MRISIIVAASDNNVIGNKGQLLWKLPKDFARMKELTMGHPLIMGRKTHESIGRALPGRRNIVITHQQMNFPGCEVVHSWEDALRAVRDDPTGEAFIFGGGDIYRQAMPMADRIYMTRIHAMAQGDAVFPEIGKEWKEVSREDHPADNNHSHAFSFVTYERVR